MLNANSEETLWDIVVVTYNHASDIKSNWTSRNFPAWINLIVVDNGSQDATLTLAKSVANTAIASENVGLSKANNLGATHGSAPYIAFCNPDITLEPHILEKLQAELEVRPAVAAPRLISEDGSPQANGRAWPTLPRIFSSRFLPKSTRTRSYQWPEGDPDWVTGAFVAMTRQTFESGIRWPEEYFLYYEDVALCALATKKNVPVVLHEHIQVIHGWHRASKRLLSRATKEHIRSAVRFYAQFPVRIWR